MQEFAINGLKEKSIAFVSLLQAPGIRIVPAAL